MGLFSRKTERVDATTTVKAVTGAKAIDYDLASVIVAPVVTEKAVGKQAASVYTFFVRKDATKGMVAKAITHLYKVTPVSVNIVNKRSALRLAGARGREVKVAGYKKAYVTVKAGESISIA